MFGGLGHLIWGFSVSGLPILILGVPYSSYLNMKLPILGVGVGRSRTLKGTLTESTQTFQNTLIKEDNHIRGRTLV